MATKGVCFNTGRTHFRKGLIPWNKGIKHSPESLEKMRLKKLGKKPSEETKRKMSLAHKGRNTWSKGSKPTAETLKKRSVGLKKAWKLRPHEFSAEHKMALSVAHRGKFCGKDSPNWKGGYRNGDYLGKFTKYLKELIRKRDNYRCQECFRHQDELFDTSGRKYKLNVHHIDYDKGNNDENNLISLCRSCHSQTNYKRENWTNYYQLKIKEISHVYIN